MGYDEPEILRSVHPVKCPPIADGGHAKAKAAALVTDAGFEVLDAGPLRQARLLEALAMLWINQAIVRGEGRTWALGVLRGDES
jgi:hypothetical protein